MVGSKNSSERKVWLGFYIRGEQGPCFHPKQLQFWHEEDFKKTPPEKPFYYKADALAGLACVHLNQHLKNPFSVPKMNYSFCFEAWRALEPHHALFERAQPRVHALRSQIKSNAISPSLQKSIQTYEGFFSDTLARSLNKNGMQLEALTELVSAIDHLENSLGSPLLYNFTLHFARETTEKMHYLHSLLFNLRTLVAMDYNAHIQDPTHEAIRVDSITDYLHKAEYVSNDAILYYRLMKQKNVLPEAAYQELKQSFWQLSHNGACLIEGLPKSFLEKMPTSDLEEGLYLVQMDWLLGTEAGLLYRIREELFALREGYEKIFWPEIEGQVPNPDSKLIVSCEITDEDVFPGAEAA